MTESTIKPISERKSDWFFVVIFSVFASTSFSWDSIIGLNMVNPNSSYPLARILYSVYAVPIDPLIAANPLWMQTMCFISAFVWGPLYLLFAYGFYTGKNWIRLPAIMYGSALTYGMVVIFVEEFWGAIPPANMALFLAFNLPYKLVPILLLFRMRKPFPFS